MKIRNIADQAHTIDVAPGQRWLVEPDETIDVPDDVGEAAVWRVEGTEAYDGEPELDPNDENYAPKWRRVPSDIWAQAVDLAPFVPPKTTAEESA